MRTKFSVLAVVTLASLVAFSQDMPLKKDKVFSRSDHKGVVGEELSIDSQHALLDKLREIYQQPELEIRKTEKALEGFTGSGVVVRRTSELITIDTTPCSNKKELLNFHKVYKESEVSDIDCMGTKYHRSKVRQE